MEMHSDASHLLDRWRWAEDSVIQVFLEMLNSECLSAAVQDTSLCRQESEQVGSEDAQLCVSLVDSQEIHEADLPGQSVLMTDYDCIGADFSVMQSFLDMLNSEHEDFVVQDLSRHLELLACSEVAQ